MAKNETVKSLADCRPGDWALLADHGWVRLTATYSGGGFMARPWSDEFGQDESRERFIAYLDTTTRVLAHRKGLRNETKSSGKGRSRDDNFDPLRDIGENMLWQKNNS